jgi:perosamine synthetase
MQTMPKLAINGGPRVRTEPWTPIYPPYSDLVEQEVEAATRLIRSRLLCAEFGPEVVKFERAYAEYLGVKHAIAVSTGTAALVVSLQALGVGLGDEVIVPAYTFLATGTSVILVNGIPVIADIEPTVQSIDLDQIKKLTTPRTKAIIPVHVNGFPMDMDPLMQFAEERGIAVIEDAAHSHGAVYKGRKTGTIGHINAFSFQQKKNLPLGEGGMITTNDDELAEKARQNRTFGKNVIGNNLRMNELHAAIGQIRLQDLDRQNEFRVRNAECLEKKLRGLPGIATQKPLPETKCVYYNFIIRYEPETLGVPRNRFIEALNAEGIVAGSLYYPLYRNFAFRHGIEPSFYRGPEAQRPSYADGTCPLAEEYCDHRNIEIKTFYPNTEREMDDVARTVTKVIENIDELKTESEQEVTHTAKPNTALAR